MEEQTKPTRYFLVSVKFSTQTGEQGTTTYEVVRPDGNYVNRALLYQHVEDHLPYLQRNTVIITNIIELSKEDYAEFTRK
jgi:hypothetical protein